MWLCSTSGDIWRHFAIKSQKSWQTHPFVGSSSSSHKSPKGEGDRGIIVMPIIRPRLELYPERSERVESAEVVSARWDSDVYVIPK